MRSSYTFPNLLLEYAMRNTHVPVVLGARQHQPERRTWNVMDEAAGARS
jgi:hypothetical protein